MPHVPKELIDTTWRAVGASTGEQIARIQESHRKAQRALFMFVYGKFGEIREDAAGVGIYVFHVVLEAFSKVLPRPRFVLRIQVERALDNQCQPGEFDPEKSIERSLEPHALRYVFEALSEDIDDVALSGQEVEYVFEVVQAVIMCLHDACERK